MDISENMDQRVRHNFRELNVWKEGMILCKLVLNLTKTFPDLEKFSLISQMNRASVSIPSNIAEGCARKSNKVFANFLEISLGSAYELETQLTLSYELMYIDTRTMKILQKS